jgi:hypothetical protein
MFRELTVGKGRFEALLLSHSQTNSDKKYAYHQQELEPNASDTISAHGSVIHLTFSLFSAHLHFL